MALCSVAKLTGSTLWASDPYYGSVVRLWGGESRKIDRSGKTQRKRKLKQDLSEYKDEEVKDAIRKGKTVVSYQET